MLILYLLLAEPAIIITEVMSNVLGSETTCGDRNEFVEIYNQSPDSIDLGAYFITDLDAAADSLHAWPSDTILIKYPGVRIGSMTIYPGSYAVILDREYTSTDTAGGNVQPYSFPDSTLILTTDDTSIGNGLAVNDPLLLYSSAATCTTTFGTPSDSTDGFPDDPGDGISWEKIAVLQPDQAANWYPAIDAAGCTPGRANSASEAVDLGLDEDLIRLEPAAPRTGEDAAIEFVVVNFGLQPATDYRVVLFDDINRSRVIDDGELLGSIDGAAVGRFDSVALYYRYLRPSAGEHVVGFTIEFSGDNNGANDRAFKTFSVGGRVNGLVLTPAVFTPDNDGVGDRVQIDYQLPRPDGALTVTIFDSRGLKICDLCRGMKTGTDHGTLYWDGRKDHRQVPTGMYIVYLEGRYASEVIKDKKTTILAR